MGILNVTPDSFSDGGKWNSTDAALKHVEEMIQDGCDIIDVGGESTRPGHEQISEKEEIKRVVPVIREIKKRFDVPVSLDTYKSKVAEAGIQAGIDMINDIWGGRYLAEVMAQADLPCILMHNRTCTEYKDFLNDIKSDLGKRVETVVATGLDPEKIILDPGIGFGKTYEQNLHLLNNLKIMNEITMPETDSHFDSALYRNRSDHSECVRFPWLLGTSRKSVIGLTLDLPQDQRSEGTLVTTVLGVKAGCSIIRVHDVKENLRAVKMTKAIMES